MSKPKQPTIAVCYDFDGTLSPENMQEHDYFPSLNIKPEVFWQQAKEQAREQDADPILSYMSLMLEKATRESGVRVTREAFQDYGRNVALFSGVLDWFDRINAYSRQRQVMIEHYLISSGIKEMIEGTPIARYFKKIYASSFMYDQHGVAFWAANAVNFTTKTQFLFRINKGCLDNWDNSRINKFVESSARPIPFTRMIYIGDGTTDIPCMKLVKGQGGYSIAVYRPNSRQKAVSEQLKAEDRVHCVLPADYTAGSLLDVQVKAVIDKMAADYRVFKAACSAR